MDVYKQRTLSLALVGAGVLGMADAAQAVSVNPRGLGEVLIYPYYTVRETSSGAAFNSLLSVSNASESAKAVKVRFLEGKNGRSVLDFNLFLSKYDVWTAAVVPTAQGAALLTHDKSCTQPLNANGDFRNYGYTGFYADFADSSLDRTREGYVEIIEMGSIYDTTGTADALLNPTQRYVTHAYGVPPGCDKPELTTGVDVTIPTGGLFGSMTLVNPQAGLDIAYEPTALEAFSKTSLFQPASVSLPNLGSVNPPVSVVQEGTKTYITDWSGQIRAGANAVSAVLMQNTLYNEYVSGGATAAQTDWVVTMPTKSLYFGSADSAKKEVPVLELFQRNFAVDGACDDMEFFVVDRDEKMSESDWVHEGLPQERIPPTLCWQTNVITFGSKPILAAKNDYPISPEGNTEGGVNFKFEEVSYDFQNYVGRPHKLTDPGTGSTLIIDSAQLSPTTQTTSITYVGLPVVGFAVQVFNNGALQTSSGAVNANYAGRLNHKGTVSIKVQ